MKALATVALVGLAYGSEDNELWRPLSKNSTVPRPRTGIPHMPAVMPRPHLPINKNHTHIPSVKPHLPVHKNHTQLPLIRPHGPVHVPHRNVTHFPHHRNTTHQPYHPIHKNATHKPYQWNHPYPPGYKKPVMADDDDEFFLWNRKNNTQKPAPKNVTHTHIPHHPLHKNTTHAIHHKNTTWNHPYPPGYKKQVIADDDDEFFVGRLLNRTRTVPHFGNRNATHIPHHKNTTHVPHHRNTTHVLHPHYNRTRPFSHLNHNRTYPNKLVAYEDEEFFAVEDNELMFHVERPRKSTYADDFEDDELKGNFLKGVGNFVKQHGPTILKVGGMIAGLDDDMDNALFDLQKLLADASKTVGDVKQKEKNYGELLNDAINIAKDLKRKDDLEDSEFMRPASTMGRTFTNGKMWGV